MIALTGYVNNENDNLFVSIERKSGVIDHIPILPRKFIDIEAGNTYTLYGDIRTYNELGEDGKRHLKLYVLVDEVEELEEIPFESNGQNDAKYYCTICSKKRIRVTPNGRVITEFMVAINYPQGFPAYVPCIAWGENDAGFVDCLDVGDELLVSGRLQSRVYTKTKEDGTEERREVYELSCASVKVVK